MGKLFISYRRKDSDFAHRLAEKLQEQIEGAVFIDRKIAKDDFVVALEGEVRECNVFALIITENTFASDRICLNDDWVRRELALALELKKPIALAMREGKTPPSPEELPENIRGVVTKQGKLIYLAFFDEGVDEFARHCIAISNGGLSLRSIQDKVHPAQEISQNASGTGFLQVGEAHAPITFTTIDNTKQTELMKLTQLQQKEDQLLKQKRGLQYDLNNSQTVKLSASSLVTYAIFGLAAIAIGFSISPVVGLVGVVAIVGWLAYKTNVQNNEVNPLKHGIETIEAELQQVRSQIIQLQNKVNKS